MNKTAHLQMIQGVINRMAGNSFLLKGWSVTLIAALFALAAAATKVWFVYLAYFPAIAFWVLDGYFLHQEKLYRALYNHVRGLPEEKIDFSMETCEFRETKNSWPRSTFTKTLLIFHGAVIGMILVVMIVLFISQV